MLFKSRPELPGSEELPALIDAIIDELKESGFIAEADRLRTLVHQMAGTTSNELYGELRLALKKIREERRDLPADIISELRGAIKSIDQICRER
jgi:hypothetical protein